jgi:hypothetical protein
MFQYGGTRLALESLYYVHVLTPSSLVLEIIVLIYLFPKIAALYLVP